MQHMIKKGLKFFGSGVLTLILMEIMARAFVPACDPPRFVHMTWDVGRGITLMKPIEHGRQWKNTGDFDVSVHIGRYGFRDSKELKSSSDRDFFVVGDSYSFGWGVEERQRFSNILEKHLGIPFFNIAAPSSDLETYGRLVDYAVENGARIRNLIIGVCMENDLDLYPERSETPDKNKPINNPFMDTQVFKEWLIFHSALYNFAAATTYHSGLLKKKMIEKTLDENFPNADVARSSASRILRLAGDRKLVVLIIPSRGLWMGNNKKNESEVHETFVRELLARGLTVVDMKPIFEKIGDPLLFYFPNDAHWNAKGHIAAADALLAVLS